MPAGNIKSTSHRIDSVFAGLVADKLIDSLQVGYDATEEGIKTSRLNVVGELIVEIIKQVKMDSKLMGNIEAFIKPERYLDALAQQMVNARRWSSQWKCVKSKASHKLDEGRSPFEEDASEAASGNYLSVIVNNAKGWGWGS